MLNNSPSIQIQNIRKSFGQVEALRDVSISVERGQIYGLLGPNGAGKTTLIRLLIGSTTPSSGQSRVIGFDPVKQKHKLRKQIGYMPQSPALYDDLPVRENITFFGRAHQSANLSRRVEEVIDFVRLSARARDPVHTLSGGMKQRVSLACALVHEPKMLFLDEPTSGMSPPERSSTVELIQKIAAEKGLTILLVEHDMDVIFSVSQRIMVMHEGRVLVSGKPEDVRGNKEVRRIYLGESRDARSRKH